MIVFLLSQVAAAPPAEPVVQVISEASACSQWNATLRRVPDSPAVDYCRDRQGVGALADAERWAGFTTGYLMCSSNNLSAGEDHPLDWSRAAALNDTKVRTTVLGFAKRGCWPEVAWLPDVECSGVLVAPLVLATAGHCADATRAEFAVTADESRDVGERWATSVVRAIRHPSEDLALLLLADDPGLAPAPWVGSVGLFWRDYPLISVGFGLQGRGQDGLGERSVTALVRPDLGMPGAGQEPCGPDEDREPTCRARSEFVAGSLLDGEPLDSAPGDSGGPIYAQVPAGSRLQTRWLLVGIASRGRSDRDVSYGQGGVYVRPDADFRWMLESIDSLLRTWVRLER